jgi:hypothetical protein
MRVRQLGRHSLLQRAARKRWMKVVGKKMVADEVGGTEGARRATGVSPTSAPEAEVPAPAGVETEVVAKAQRRRFTAEYKRRVVREADRCRTAVDARALLSCAAVRLHGLTLTAVARQLDVFRSRKLVKNAG